MNTELVRQGLMIAAMGMGLVFVVIIFLWGLMALLMRLTSCKGAPTVETLATELADSGPAAEINKMARQRQAAAAGTAVSLALAADHKRRTALSRRGRKGEVSAWQAFHRSRGTNPEERQG